MLVRIVPPPAGAAPLGRQARKAGKKKPAKGGGRLLIRVS